MFVPVPEAKTGKNRVHLDLATESAEHQAAEVDRLLGLGAVHADIGQGVQGQVPWVVLADPEGNEFCVLDPRPVYRDTGPVAAVVADCRDPAAVAEFWRLATGWVPGNSADGGVSLRSPAGVGPYLELLPSADIKTVKNRVHLDVAPFKGDDHAAAVAALRDGRREAGRRRAGRCLLGRTRRPGRQRVLRAVTALTPPGSRTSATARGLRAARTRTGTSPGSQPASRGPRRRRRQPDPGRRRSRW